MRFDWGAGSNFVEGVSRALDQYIVEQWNFDNFCLILLFNKNNEKSKNLKYN